MKVNVLGIQNVDYISKRSGQPVKGLTLHASYRDQLVEGEAVTSVFVSDNLKIPCLYDIKPGDIVDVEYNQRGYVAGLEIVG